jgi:hypothetical protein
MAPRDAQRHINAALRREGPAGALREGARPSPVEPSAGASAKSVALTHPTRNRRAQSEASVH